MKFFKNTGNWLIIGFVSAALGMLFLAYKATTVKFDMVVEGDYYQLETSFNDLLVAKSNASYLGRDFNFKEEGGKIILQIPEHLSREIEEGHIEFYCVSNSDFDTMLPLAGNAEGIYQFNKATIARGHNYVVKVGFKAKSKEYYKEFKMQ